MTRGLSCDKPTNESRCESELDMSLDPGDTEMRAHLLVVHEHGRRWIEALKSQLRGWPVIIRHSALAADAIHLARSAGSSTLLLVLSDRPVRELELLAQIRIRSLDVAVVVIAKPHQMAIELGVRELGADAFLEESIAAVDLTRVLRCVLMERGCKSK